MCVFPVRLQWGCVDACILFLMCVKFLIIILSKIEGKIKHESIKVKLRDSIC